MEIKKCAKAADPTIKSGGSNKLLKIEAMWFFISDNFDLKIETLILLDKIQMSSFNQNELEKFIQSIESQMLKDMNQSNVQDDSTNDAINLAESMRFDDDKYRTVKFDQYGTAKNEKLNKNMRRKTENIGHGMMKKPTWGSSNDNFDELSGLEKKQWLLHKIMELNISSNVQNQLVDRIEGIMRNEEKEQSRLKREMMTLEEKIKRLKQNKSQNQMDEGKILEELESKEKQLIQLESEYQSVNEQLMRVEKEKTKMEENFVGEILGLQTGLDQKLIQIQTLDQRNKELTESKKDLEDMVDEYKKYSETCKKRTKEVEEEKNAQIRELRKEIDWQKTSFEQKRENLIGKMDVEKIALEQTIKELMFKNKVS
jgi:chromosome segregation ATPase